MLPMVKLLAVDDTPSSLELLSESLRQEGLAIFTSTDPEEGLELVYREHPQVVLLDLVMPKMGGLQMLERIVEFDPAIDVILMTAHYTTETAVEAIQKGACDYLNKPVSIPALRTRVAKLVAEARQRQRAPGCHQPSSSRRKLTRFVASCSRAYGALLRTIVRRSLLGRREPEKISSRRRCIA